MFIDKKFQLWKTVGSEEQKPTLGHISIYDKNDLSGLDSLMLRAIPDDHNGLAVTTDGFSLVVVPVVLEDGDITGLIPADTLKDSARLSGKLYEGRSWIGLTDPEFFDMPQGMRYARPDNVGVYPDWSPIIPKYPGRESDRSFLSFDIRLLLAISRGLGVQFRKYSSANLTVSFNGDEMAPYYIIEGKPASSSVMAPFALLMPMHYNQ
jgi:hypothetical protein